MFLAAGLGYSDIVKILLPFEKEIVNNNKETALMAAAFTKNE